MTHKYAIGSLVEVQNPYTPGIRLFVTHQYFNACCGEPVYALSMYPVDKEININPNNPEDYDHRWVVYGQFRLMLNVAEPNLSEVTS